MGGRATCPPGGLVVEAEFEDDAPAFLPDRVEAWLGMLGCSQVAQLESARDDGPWQPGWSGVFKGGLLGARFWIAPPWADDAPSAREVLRLDPRGGFGSGQHPATVACVEALEALEPAGSLLDVGAGSGVLTLVAERLGWRAVALERDLVARARCAATLSANQAAARIEERALAELDASFDLVVANLSVSLVQSLASELVRTVRPGGRMLLGGFRRADRAQVQAAYAGLQDAGAWGGPSEEDFVALLLRLSSGQVRRN